MRIRLTRRVPVEARHGMENGSEHEVIEHARGGRGRNGYWVRGDGENVLIRRNECEVIEESTPKM